MEKLSTTIMLVVLASAIGISGASAKEDNVIAMPGQGSTNDLRIIKPRPVEDWFETLDSAREVRTKIQFYFQDVLGGDNPTVWQVAEAEITPISSTSFGRINMIDDLLTAGPEQDSEVVGRAQGTIGFADFHENAIQMGLNIIFTHGEYKGSTISILGRNPIFQNDRELPIVGGTGVFRMARGIALTNTHSFNETTNHGVLEYTLYVTHYSL